MPGRYSLTDPKAAMELLFGVECPAERPLYNIAPSWNVPEVRDAAGGGLEAVMMRWGLVPRWARKITEGAKLHNARYETLAEKRTFRTPSPQPPPAPGRGRRRVVSHPFSRALSAALGRGRVIVRTRAPVPSPSPLTGEGGVGGEPRAVTVEP